MRRIDLECGSCGERLVLLGDEDDWSTEGDTAFACGCGVQLTLGDRVKPGEAFGARLMRALGATWDRVIRLAHTG